MSLVADVAKLHAGHSKFEKIMVKELLAPVSTCDGLNVIHNK